MPVAAYYRAIGKLSDPRSGIPTSTTDLVSLDAALDAGRRLVEEGRWAEFYVKTIYRNPRRGPSDVPVARGDGERVTVSPATSA